eukprot:TRINITY_DN4474_c0_g1_i8.p1 TRINITY_DN4474_c0_g1~~TRINITY_DN4474_c0_g1_i8.p1  ORF type:complete len:1012 (+),score=283.63 TRINITY_DN4474_c0_g1_i8:147-3182(+)
MGKRKTGSKAEGVAPAEQAAAPAKAKVPEPSPPPAAPAAQPAATATSGASTSIFGSAFGFGSRVAPKAPKAAQPPPPQPTPELVVPVEVAPKKAAAKAPEKAPAKAVANTSAKASAKAPAKAAVAAPEPPTPAQAAAGEKTAPAPESKKAKAKAKAAAAAAAAAAASAPVVPTPPPAPEPEPVAAPKSKSKKNKNKAQAEEPPPPPPPPPPPVEEEQDAEAAKKKKNRRGGRNKKAGGEEEPIEVQPAAPTGPTGMELADIATEKDAELVSLRARLPALEEAVAANKGNSVKADIGSLIADIDKLLTERKTKTTRSASHKLAQSVLELEKSDGDRTMLEDAKKQLEEARASEVYTSLSSKLKALKVRCEELLKTSNKVPLFKAQAVAAAAQANEAKEVAAEEAREASLIRRLETMHEKKSGELLGTKPITKTLEREPEVMKYLFTTPWLLCKRLEANFLVVVDAVRPKVKGKGYSKGAVPGKELIVAGLTDGEVNKCVAEIKALDFSGTQTKDLSNDSIVSSWAKVKELEQEFGVFSYKQKNTLTIFGPKKKVEAAFAKAESTKVEKVQDFNATLSVEPAISKAMRNMMGEWRVSTNTQIRVVLPQQDGESKLTKIFIKGKTQAEVDDAEKKINAYATSMAADLKAGDFKKLKDRGLELNEILKMGNFEPVKIQLKSEQIKVFSREAVSLIAHKSGAEINFQRGGKGSDSCLMIYGGTEPVRKAQAEIDEIMSREGSVETLSSSDSVMKELLAGGGGKIKDLEAVHDVAVSLNWNKSEVTIIGAAAGVQAVKKEIARFSAKVEKEIANTITRRMTVESAYIPRIIGSKGSNLKYIKENCRVQVNILESNSEETTESDIDIKGVEEEVTKAEKMIKDMIDNFVQRAKEWEERDSVARVEPNGKAKGGGKGGAKQRKKIEEYKGSLTGDFPSLQGDAPGPNAKATANSGKLASRWGKDATHAKAEVPTKEESFPSLGGGAKEAENENGEAEEDVNEEAEQDVNEETEEVDEDE